MKSLFTASALIFLMAGSAHAGRYPCETFDRSNTDAPQFVRDWLEDDSERLYVKACDPGNSGNYRLYLGAGNLAGNGNVCRHLLYELDLSSTSPPRLERRLTPHATATYMLLSKSKECPSPEVIDYVWTDHLPQDVFEPLVHFWNDATSSAASFDGAVSGTFDADRCRSRGCESVRRDLRNVILRGQNRRLAAERMYSDPWLRGPLEGYVLGFTNPDHSDRGYLVSVIRSGRAFFITDFSASWY